ncbi:uncharacterized protein LOC144035076 isoform X1 [Vanacampus margaritifer]
MDTSHKIRPKSLSDTGAGAPQSIVGNGCHRSEKQEDSGGRSSSLHQKTHEKEEEEKRQVATKKRNGHPSLLEEVTHTHPFPSLIYMLAHGPHVCMLQLSTLHSQLEASLHLHEQRAQEVDFLSRQENTHMWCSLHFLRLSQQLAKPWVSSYFRRFPMHIYCLPVQPANRRARKVGGGKTIGRGGAT